MVLTQSFFDANRNARTTGHILGRGGEGTVYSITGSTDHVVKIYSRPLTPELSTKIEYMSQTKSLDLLKIAAWPTEVVFDQSGEPIGFCMPQVKEFLDLHDLNTTKSRRAKLPSADWSFLLHVAINTAKAFAALHTQDVVVGDVNERNIKVSRDGIVRLIDCDSFQIRSKFRVFYCSVGVGTHTPPEIQGMPLDRVVRTSYQDAFGLGIVIFQLLFLGRHPFSGIPKSSNVQSFTIEDAIRDRRFAYGNLAGSRDILPPPFSLRLEALGPEITGLFNRTFLAQSSEIMTRPSAREWVATLLDMQKQLTQCRDNPSHQYPPIERVCPWCKIEQAASVVLFASRLSQPTIGSPGFSLEVFLANLTSLTLPSALPKQLPGLEIAIVIAPDLKRLGRARRIAILKSLIGIVTTFTIALVMFPSAMWAWLVLVIAVSIGFLFLRSQDADRRSAIVIQKQELSQIQRQLEPITMTWKSLDTPTLEQAKRSLENLIAEYRGLAELRASKRRQVEASARDRQLSAHILAHGVERAKIPGIGPVKKSTLRAYGIVTAADLRKTVPNMPGIGPNLLANLLAWRDTVYSSFAFNPSLAFTQQDQDSIDLEIQERRRQLESDLTSGVIALKWRVEQVNADRLRIEPTLRALNSEMKQKQRNLHALGY